MGIPICYTLPDSKSYSALKRPLKCLSDAAGGGADGTASGVGDILYEDLDSSSSLSTSCWILTDRRSVRGRLAASETLLNKVKGSSSLTTDSTCSKQCLCHLHNKQPSKIFMPEQQFISCRFFTVTARSSVQSFEKSTIYHDTLCNNTITMYIHVHV